ncbi:MAG: xylose isomerase [Actinomycetota bacterium]|nr:xylose isomerase [Actinomycetota bacterium]MDD5665937.1 xylose isomerase [Actinomycetota bacterium]
MEDRISCHSVCRWTFHAGKGGFVPEDAVPEWAAARLDTPGAVELVGKRIAPRLPAHIRLGMELHYDYEVDESNAGAVAEALLDSGIHLALITPGAHRHFAYGGIASLDGEERRAARGFCERTVDLAYGPLRKAWNPEPGLAPSLALWNGSYGYDLATVGVAEMYRHLKEGVAGLCGYEAKKGGELFVAIEPKPNEGHPAMLLPTVASAILFWKRLREEYGVDLAGKGVNKEFGHSEMIGLDHVYDTAEEIDNGMLAHMHVNSQGLSDGIILGGPGKFDIDHGARINGMNVAIAGLARRAGYARWKGHDMQARPYDNEEQAIDRVIRSILSWEACEMAEREMDTAVLLRYLERRETARAEDLVREAVMSAYRHFDAMYKG